MKKLLGLLLAMAIAFPASAAVVKNVELKGEVQTIASDVRHNAGHVYNSGASTRALAGLSFDVVEDVKANVLFQYGYFWGTENDQLNGFDNADGLKLVNANVELYNLFCFLEATIGRQFYGDENSAVMYFGPNHYNAETGLSYATALDAVKLSYNDDFKTFTVLAGTLYRADEDSTNENVFGADLKLNLTDDVTFQVYGYDFRNFHEYDKDGVLLTEENAGLYGAKFAFAQEAFRVSAEYARNFGGERLVKEHHATGQMVKADIAADIAALTARGAFFYATEDFWAFGNYTPGLMIGHKLAGSLWKYSDKGVRMYNIGFDVKPADKWTVSLDGFLFQDRQARMTETYEADLTAKYTHNAFVELFAGVGYAKYGKSYKDAVASDNVKGQLGMLIKF